MKKLSYAVILFFIMCTLCGCRTNTEDFNNVVQDSQIKQVSDAENKDVRIQITDVPKKIDEKPINAENAVNAVIASPVSENPERNFSYIVNKNTKKFHNPDCRSVTGMKESNKKYLTCGRSDAIAQGYSPCGNCNP